MKSEFLTLQPYRTGYSTDEVYEDFNKLFGFNGNEDIDFKIFESSRIIQSKNIQEMESHVVPIYLWSMLSHHALTGMYNSGALLFNPSSISMYVCLCLQFIPDVEVIRMVIDLNILDRDLFVASLLGAAIISGGEQLDFLNLIFDEGNFLYLSFTGLYNCICSLNSKPCTVTHAILEEFSLLICELTSMDEIEDYTPRKNPFVFDSPCYMSLYLNNIIRFSNAITDYVVVYTLNPYVNVPPMSNVKQMCMTTLNRLEHLGLEHDEEQFRNILYINDLYPTTDIKLLEFIKTKNVDVLKEVYSQIIGHEHDNLFKIFTLCDIRPLYTYYFSERGIEISYYHSFMDHIIYIGMIHEIIPDFKVSTWKHRASQLEEYFEIEIGSEKYERLRTLLIKYVEHEKLDHEVSEHKFDTIVDYMKLHEVLRYFGFEEEANIYGDPHIVIRFDRETFKISIRYYE